MVFIEERFIFTYADYLKWCDNLRYFETEENFISFAEDSSEYTLDNGETEIIEKKSRDKKHDKIFKDIFQNKNEMAQFLSDFISYEISADELQNYNANFITKNFKYKQIDILYKIKGEEIYILLEHQTKVDYIMPYRILNYCIEVVRAAVENTITNKLTYKFPVIMPIVLYTGGQKWTAPISFIESQVEDKNTNFKAMDIEYKLIDINKYDVKELLNKHTMFANVMILEKCKNNKDVINCLKEIVSNLKDDKQKEELKRIVMYLYNEINTESLEEMIKMIEESECGEIMSTISERIGREFRNERKKARDLGLAEGRAEGRKEGRAEGRAEGRKEGIAEGIIQGISQTIEKMIKMNFKDEIIKEATGVEKTQIQKIRRQIMNA